MAATNDNVAIATVRIEAGTRLLHHQKELTIGHTVLEGHRFAVETIREGDFLLSWGMPFGEAIQDIQPGDYVCNRGVLDALQTRSITAFLPADPNFSDAIPPFTLADAEIATTPALLPEVTTQFFDGYHRPGGRGVGTRNMILLIGTTVRCAGFVRQLEQSLQPLVDAQDNIDGIVAIAHTEGDEQEQHNRDLILRTLAGYMVHPNTAAVIAFDYGSGSLTNADLQSHIQQAGLPIEHVPHQFWQLEGSFAEELDAAGRYVEKLVALANTCQREPAPLSALKIALQCGGSDAFSGISGNPLASWVAREVIRHGGQANLAETDELIGAEAYIVKGVTRPELARKFIRIIDRFTTLASWHGSGAAGNPSGGNKFRGLYNIYLKSLGAAMKRHPDVPVEGVIDYSQPMTHPGFYFMDSPGNDLESIAGQVASGCNMIFFVTGNGSITNFPFVPTIKIVTTTRRFELLEQDMDVNAGEYLDGVPMDTLGQRTLDLTLRVASGQPSSGERAGHAQVQLWRNWRRTEAPTTASPDDEAFSEAPIPVPASQEAPEARFQLVDGKATEQLGLILPTSLCSGQVALMLARQLNESAPIPGSVNRFVALAHTEGCGASSGPSEDLYMRTLIGYLKHPNVGPTVLLEHGCEKTHNDYMRLALEKAGIDTSRFGWASIQADGGIQRVLMKLSSWFRAHATVEKSIQPAGWEAIRIGILTPGTTSAEVSALAGHLVAGLTSASATVVMLQDDALLEQAPFYQETGLVPSIQPTTAFASIPTRTGFHLMQCPTGQWSEKVTGLAAAGLHALIAFPSSHALTGHPVVPLLLAGKAGPIPEKDLDILLQDDLHHNYDKLIEKLVATLQQQYQVTASRLGNLDFQISRGSWGVSL